MSKRLRTVWTGDHRVPPPRSLARHPGARAVREWGRRSYSTAGDPPSGVILVLDVEAMAVFEQGRRLADRFPPGPLYTSSPSPRCRELPPGVRSPSRPLGYGTQTLLGYLRPQNTAPPGGTIVFSYDTGANGKGRRSAMTGPSGTETYAYDALGRPTSVTRTIDGAATALTTFNALGRVATLAYPDGEVVTYGYTAGPWPRLWGPRRMSPPWPTTRPATRRGGGGGTGITQFGCGFLA